MSKIDVTYIDSLDITKMSNTQVTVSDGLMTLTPLPSDESEYERGMRKAMQKIAASCGKKFAVDIGYESLPDLVESLVNPKQEKPKRVKVEWECVHHSEAVHYFSIEGFCLYDEPNGSEYNELQDYINNLQDNGTSNLYRRIETEIDERQEFIDAYMDLAKNSIPLTIDGWAGMIYDSGKFKLVNAD